MNPAQFTKVDVPVKLKELRTLTAPAKVSCSVCLADAPGDAVIGINGEKPRDIIDAYAQLLKVKADGKVTVTFASAQPKTIHARAVAPPDAVAQARKRLGVKVEALTPAMAEKYGVAVEDGMLITEVLKDTPAAQAGLRPGDVITGVGNYRVESMDDFATLLQYLPQSGRVRLEVVRGNQQGGVVLRL
jgi:S1-C subfamily serine protease